MTSVIQCLYNEEFIRRNEGFTPAQKKQLQAVNNLCSLTDLLQNKAVMSTIGLEFVFSSVKIEGSTLTRQETATIITTGKTVGGLPISDVIMTKNLSNAFNYIIKYDLPINLRTMHELHALLANGLISNPKKLGGMKNEINKVTGGIDYTPLGPGPQLKSETDEMFRQYEQIADPFDRALYIHNNCAYLQYFTDCNKRVSRCMMLASMKHDGILPFFIIYNSKTEESYLGAMIDYYATGSTAKIRDFFFSSYLELGNLIENAELIKEINGKINNVDFTAVITTSDPANEKILEQIGQKRQVRRLSKDVLYFVDVASLKNSGLNPFTCSIYTNLESFLNQKSVSAEAVAQWISSSNDSKDAAAKTNHRKR